MRLGIDLGRTKIEIIALADDGRTLLRQRVATPQGDYMATLMAVAGLVEATENALGQRGSVGLGIPGAESLASGLIKNANCFALSEAIDGAGRDAGIVFGAILGTGVGGGIVIDRRVLTGANAIAGEWGHNPLPLPTGDDLPLPACYCGRQGCVEAYLSGPALTADHRRHTGQDVDASAIDAAAAAGDAASEATLCRYEERLGRALAGVINLLDPEVIVLGGGLSNMARLYRNLPECCGRHVFSDVFRTRFLPPVHGDSSGVRGAAWLWN